MRQGRGPGQPGWGTEWAGETAEPTGTGCGGEGLRRRVTCAAGEGRVGPADIGFGPVSHGSFGSPNRARRGAVGQ